jgi:hypothetical protein
MNDLIYIAQERKNSGEKAENTATQRDHLFARQGGLCGQDLTKSLKFAIFDGITVGTQ